MATNYVAPGKILELTAPYDRTSGQGMQVGSIFAVALGTALSGAAITGQVDGVWTLTKVGSQAWAVGDKVYWDNSNKRCTTVATDGMLIGIATAVVASGAGDTTGNVRLNGVSPSALEGPQTTIAAIAGTLTGTVDGTIADIAATAGACAGGATPTAANVDTAIATAVATIVTGTNTQLKELQTTVNAILVALKAAGIVASA